MNMRMQCLYKTLVLPAAVLLALVGSSMVCAAEENGTLAELKSFFEGGEVRTPGSVGNRAIESKVAKRFTDSGFVQGEIKTQVASFLPGKTLITVDGLAPIGVMPMHPTLFRPGNFKQREFEARLVYLGRGDFEDLKAAEGIDLAGAIALMKFESGANWQRMLRLGVRGFVFIGQDKHSYYDSATKVYATEVSVPRFFVSAVEGALLRERVRDSGGSLKIQVSAEPSRWENRPASSPWVFIAGADATLGQETCVIVAPIDSDSIVPQMGYGMQSGANLFMLMQMLETFKKHPPARSVLLVAVNARTQSYFGDRLLAWYLLADMADISEIRDLVGAEIRRQRVFVDYYSRLNIAEADKETGKLLVKMRTLVDESTGKKVLVKAPIVALAKRDVNSIKSERVEIERSKVLSRESKDKVLSELDESYRKHVNVLTVFNRVGVKTNLDELSAAERKILAEYVELVIGQNTTWSRLNSQELQEDRNNVAIRRALEGRKVAMVISLELNWANTRIGFSSCSTKKQNWPAGFGAASVRVAKELEKLEGDFQGIFTDTMTKLGGEGQLHYFYNLLQSARIYRDVERTPAFSLANVYVGTGRAFTPDDTIENLSEENVSRLSSYVQDYFRALLDDAGISTAEGDNLPPRVNRLTSLVKTFEYGKFAASVVPSIPVSNSVILVYDDLSFANLLVRRMDLPISRGQVTGCMPLMTDSRASRVVRNVMLEYYGNAYLFDEDFREVLYTIDWGEAQESVPTEFKRNQSSLWALFPCKEFVVYDRADASLVSNDIITVENIFPLSSARDTAPRKYGIWGMSSVFTKSPGRILKAPGPAALYTEKTELIKLVSDNKRSALNSTKDDPTGRGFMDSDELGSDFFGQASRDMSVLNEERLENMGGVTDALAQEYLAKGAEARKSAEDNRARKDHVGERNALHHALGSEVKAYDQITATRNDMLKAIVFFMALLLPFCFFVQKLLFKFVKIEAQMGAFAVLFVITFMIFRWIHPAFSVAQSPGAIFIAFVMAMLGLFVIHILHSRFEGEMQLLFRTYTTMDTSEVGYSTVGQTAMLISVDNMKRRRIRTTLTTGTIVLITFCMLTFSSISRKISPTVIPVSKDMLYTGVFYSWPGNLRMDEDTLGVFEDLFSDKGEVLVRRWLLPAAMNRGDSSSLYNSPLYVESSGGTSAAVDAALGVQVAEEDVLGKLPIVEGRFFQKDDADEVIVTAALARAMKISASEVGTAKIILLGHEFTVVGLLDDLRFSQRKDLNDRPILPIRDIIKQAGEKEREAGEKINPLKSETGVFYVSTGNLLVLPEQTAKRLGAEPFSVSVHLADDADVWPIMESLLTVTEAKFFVGSRVPFSIGKESKRKNQPGIYYIGSGYSTSIGGLSSLIIPLLIAATLILNTMLGAVYERKNEIAVYNAIGLNPTHISLFFLAEAFVYAVIGAVGGYLIGQVFAIGLTKFNLIEGLNLNFSSLSVAYVIVFVVAIVVLSTLYPAKVATRTAIPSGKRKWSMPEHDQENMEVLFPFIYHPSIVIGVMAYIQKYFAQFTEGSIGNVIAGLESRSTGKDAQSRAVYSITYSLALAPFDLGVTQQVRFLAAYDETVDSYNVKMNIRRVSGQDSNWVTVNKPFLEKLRKYLMHWRNLDQAQHAMYVQLAAQEFGNKGDVQEK